MKDRNVTECNNCQSGRGIVLLVTLVLLVVLSSIGYTLSIRVADRRHRDNYIINYQSARYACDSATKYAITVFENIDVNLVGRPNEPDFSSLFALDEEEYNEYLDEWVQIMSEEDEDEGEGGDFERGIYDTNDLGMFESLFGANDINNMLDDDFGNPNSLVVRGPYGPQWPFITEPMEFEIGIAKVRIQIEDENAKYPLYWAIIEDKDIEREALAGFESFCEWMDVNDNEIDLLIDQFKQVSEIKPFKRKLQPIKVRTTVQQAATKSKRKRRRGRRRARSRTKTVTKTTSVTEQVSDFAKLLHSSLIDFDILAKPTIVSETRNENALKYMAMWASRKVNVNTAPQHVLEAVFVFGGDEVEIAEEIIEQRRMSVFKNTEDLQNRLFGYSDSIKKCEEFITTKSNFFTIRITATSGVARASTIIAVTRDGKKVERIAVISG